MHYKLLLQMAITLQNGSMYAEVHARLPINKKFYLISWLVTCQLLF